MSSTFIVFRSFPSTKCNLSIKWKSLSLLFRLSGQIWRPEMKLLTFFWLSSRRPSAPLGSASKEMEHDGMIGLMYREGGRRWVRKRRRRCWICFWIIIFHQGLFVPLYHFNFLQDFFSCFIKLQCDPLSLYFAFLNTVWPNIHFISFEPSFLHCGWCILFSRKIRAVWICAGVWTGA